MGIFVQLKIIPHKINKSDWEAAYLEAKQLIQAYPFLDISCDTDSYNCEWNYADSPLEEPIRFCDNYVGFRLRGDLRTMRRGESFELIHDLNYYLKHQKEQTYEDVLSYYLNLDNPAGILKVFNEKTQGYDYHQPILAIACLFEDRLQPYAMAGGDVSLGQMQAAIKWANGILSKPIQLPQRANNQILLERIRKITSDEVTALSVFMEATLNALNHELGVFIRENFSRETISQYYVDRMKCYSIGTYGFSDTVKEYLNLCHDLGDLCDLSFNQKNKNPEAAQRFIEIILNSGIHLTYEDTQREKQKQDATMHSLESSNPKSNKPDIITSLFGKVFLKMVSGNLQQSAVHIPLNRILDIFAEKLGKFCNVHEITDYYFSEQKSESEHDKQQYLPDCLKNILEKEQEVAPVVGNYDIEDLEDLILWIPELTIAPEIIDFMFKVRDFVEKALIERKALLESFQTHEEKMKFLIKNNTFFCITKKNWDYIENRIENTDFFKRIAGVLMIKASEITIHRLCTCLMNNNKLLEKFVLGE